MKFIKKLICKITSHIFYNATAECEKTKCVRCDTWFDIEKAWGKWI